MHVLHKGVLAAFCCLFFSSIAQSQIASGSLVVLQVGDGSAALSNASTAVFLNTYSTSGVAGPVTTLLSAGTANNTANLLTMSGTATSEGQITRSTNGLFIAVSGYSAPAGVAAIAGTTSVANNRGALTVDGSGAFGNYRTSTTYFTGNNPRSATFNGTNFYVAGPGVASSSTNGAINLLSNAFPSDNQTAITSSPVANTRVVRIINGNTYYTNSSNTAGIESSIWTVSGQPTSSGQVATKFIQTQGTGTGTASPYSFDLNTAGNVAYIADDRTIANGGGIQKWTFNGTAWSLAYTLGTGSASTTGARGLAVDWSNPNSPTIYATSGDTNNRLIAVTDAGAGSTSATLATAGTNRAFRGVDIGLLPAVYTNSGDGAFNTSSNWSLNVNSADRNGINLLFQNVHVGANGATATVTNDQTAVSAVSSIVFRDLANGYGGGSFTQFTLAGSNGLTLNGVAATNIDVAGTGTGGFAGIHNGSGITQTLNVPLTVSGAQTFRAQSGDLVFGGTILLGDGSTAGNLSINGNANTTINGAIADAGGAPAGSLSKTGSGLLFLNGTNTSTAPVSVTGGVLGGTGQVAASVTVGGGGAIRGGNANGQGTLTLNSGLTLAAGAVTSYRITDGSTPSGALGGSTLGPMTTPTSNNYINITGGVLAFNPADLPTFHFNVDGTGTSFVNGQPYSYRVGQVAGQDLSTVVVEGVTVQPLFTAIGFQATDFSLRGDAAGNLYIGFTPVPEPGAVLGVAVGVLGLGMFIRRRRSETLVAG